MGREPVSLYDPIDVIFWKGQTRMAKNGSVVARDWGALGAFGVMQVFSTLILLRLCGFIHVLNLI